MNDKVKKRIDKERDIAILADELLRIAPRILPSTDPAWTHPLAIRVIDCVLSLNRNYDNFVVPRLRVFMETHPNIQSVRQLNKFIESYSSPALFVKTELSYNHEYRARILYEVVDYLSNIVESVPFDQEENVLSEWAVSAKPNGYSILNIKGFALAGYQYLRMLLGASTLKPDKHIIDFVSEQLSRSVSDVEALELLENAAISANCSIRDVDTTIWEIRARS